MPDFLLELRSEEIPARMQPRAREDLARLFAAELTAAGIAPGEIVTYATPRRLALIGRDLHSETAATSEEIKGPKASAPPQALDGFLRKTGLTRDQLVERGGVLYAVTDKPGRPTADILAQAILTIIRTFPWPKSMRWGATSTSTESLRWVRPLQGIVALFGDAIVPVEIAGITSGATTVGHRFHHPGPITLGGAHDYVEKLRACHVVVDPAERETIIAMGATMLAAKAGLMLVRDEALLAENAGLTEWPVPHLGRFDPAFLSVPPEVIRLTARVNQKYFVCQDAEGKLADAFICTANIDADDDGRRIVEGNRKVFAARLSDARFFYDGDLRVPLEEQAGKLDRIVFHEKLGTVADKVDRVAKLARWLVEEGIVGAEPVAPQSATSQPVAPQPATPPHLVSPANAGVSSRVDAPAHNETPAFAGVTMEGVTRDQLAHLAERAARLCKADLVTGMVGEFPELQGLMGGYYAAAQGEHPAVADAIRDHYKPVGQGDAVPTAPVTVAVSLADKLDTLVGFFGRELRPTGSKDPFALRRAMISTLTILVERKIKVSFAALLKAATSSYVAVFSAVYRDLTEFAVDRLKVQQREAGVRHDLIDAVFALGGEDDLVRLLARVRALQAFVGTEDGANLLTGYKRAANILKKEGWTASASQPAAAQPDTFQPAAPQLVTPANAGVSGGEGAPADHETPAYAGVTSMSGEGNEKPLSYTPDPVEQSLRAALDSAEPRARAAVGAEEFEGAMAALATLRAPIDAFFDTVTVNDPDPAKREARLALLARVRDAVHAVADFSRIEG